VITLPTGTQYDASNTAWRAQMTGITAVKTIVVALDYKVTFALDGGTKTSGDLVQWIEWDGDAAQPGVTPPTGKHWARQRRHSMTGICIR
jgi:hypothetical protein